MASATSSSVTASQSIHGWTYDVFLNFRGPDTRNTFTDFLHILLKSKGIRTFKDDNQIEKGDYIPPALVKAIEESRFFVAVFSKDYASSKWCLEELATIMERQEKFKDQIVVPIFYHVSASDVKHQTGSFEASFKEHEKNVKLVTEGKVKRWREALKKAGGLEGHHLKNEYKGHEGECANGVVANILDRLNRSTQASPALEGLKSRVNYIGNWLRLVSDDAADDAAARFIGICGMGGIGKTTIAETVFNKSSSEFEGACFLQHVREHKIVELQKTLITKMLKEKSAVEISNEQDGRQKIKLRFKAKRVLIVLDDVDNVEQLQELAGCHDWFGKGSRVIITTRDAGVLRRHEVDTKYIYEVEKLGEREAMEVFSWYAFKQKIPKKSFERLCGSIVSYAMGLPLVLRVLGSHLRGQKDDVYWNNILVKLEDSGSVVDPKYKILNVLMISFDGLDPDSKNVFLNIACFFRNEREEFVKGVLDESDLSGLIDKSLISVQNGEIEMHDRIQEMGLHIASKENPRKMVWQLKDANDVLSQNMEHIEGIKLIDDDLGGACERNTFEITPRGMRNLKLLKVGGSNIVFSLNEKYFPSSLRWLEFQSYHFDSLPESFPSPELVGLSLQKSSLQNCRITQTLNKLTLLDLSFSCSLSATPDFDLMPNLKRLDLSCCRNLKEVHPSIGNLRQLVFMDLSDCCNLESLPSFNQVSSLNSLYLCGCLKLKNFPEIKEGMPHLVELELSNVGIIELPSSIQQLHDLTKLYLDGCEHLVCLSNGFCELKNLKVLVINSCTNLKSLPENLQDLTSLEYLNLNGSYLDSFPESFNQLPCLQYLDIRNCENLKELPELPETTCELYADPSFAYREDIDELADFPKLQSVAFSSSYKVVWSEYDFAEMCIHFPSCRKTPFSVTYPIYSSEDGYEDPYDEVNVLRVFQYRCYRSNGIAIDLNPGWNCQSFVGFGVYFLTGLNTWGLHSYSDIADVEHCTIIVKLPCKDNRNEVLEIKCVRLSDDSNSKGSLCFAYIPFSGLWPAKSNSVTSRFEVNFMDSEVTAHWGCSLLYQRWGRPASWDNSWEGTIPGSAPDYLVFEATIQDLEIPMYDATPNWSCGLLYTDDESLTKEIRQKREAGSSFREVDFSESDSGSKTEEEEEEEEEDEDGGSGHTEDSGEDDAMADDSNSKGTEDDDDDDDEDEDEGEGEEEEDEEEEDGKSEHKDSGGDDAIAKDSNPGKEGEDEERGESLHGDKDVVEDEAKESNAGHEVEVTMSEYNDSGAEKKTSKRPAAMNIDELEARLKEKHPTATATSGAKKMRLQKGSIVGIRSPKSPSTVGLLSADLLVSKALEKAAAASSSKMDVLPAAPHRKSQINIVDLNEAVGLENIVELGAEAALAGPSQQLPEPIPSTDLVLAISPGNLNLQTQRPSKERGIDNNDPFRLAAGLEKNSNLSVLDSCVGEDAADEFLIKSLRSALVTTEKLLDKKRHLYNELSEERSRVTELEDKNRQLEALVVQLQNQQPTIDHLEKEKHELTLLVQTSQARAIQAEAANSNLLLAQKYLLDRYGTLEKQQLEDKQQYKKLEKEQLEVKDQCEGLKRSWNDAILKNEILKKKLLQAEQSGVSNWQQSPNFLNEVITRTMGQPEQRRKFFQVLEANPTGKKKLLDDKTNACLHGMKKMQQAIYNQLQEIAPDDFDVQKWGLPNELPDTESQNEAAGSSMQGPGS